jgi:lysozyme family protein
MADFNSAIAKTLQKEGGSKYTETVGDRGGATKYGISQSSYPNINIRELTEQQARDIYKRDYWDRVCGDRIHDQVIAESIFDAAVNMGVRTASRLAQLSAGMPEAHADGIIGTASLRELSEVHLELFVLRFATLKIARYAHICNKDKTQSKFLLGWINRALGGAA